MLLVRGVPALFVYRNHLAPAYRRSLVFLQSTALPLVVVITEIGRQTNRLSAQNAAALVGAAMLTMLIFPVLGLMQLRHAEPDDDPEPARVSTTSLRRSWHPGSLVFPSSSVSVRSRNAALRTRRDHRSNSSPTPRARPRPTRVPRCSARPTSSRSCRSSPGRTPIPARC